RDAVAADIAPVLSLSTPRDPADWPAVTPRAVPDYQGKIPAPEAALGGLCRATLHACVALAAHLRKDSPELTQQENITRADGIALIHALGGDAFTGLRNG